MGSDVPFGGGGQSSESPGVESSGRRSRSSFESSSLGVATAHMTEDSSTETSFGIGRLPVAAADADEINNLLNMIDSKPQLKGSVMFSKQGDVVLKSQADQALKRIVGSIHDSFTQGFAVPGGGGRRSKLSMEGNVRGPVLEEDEEEEEVQQARERERERNQIQSALPSPIPQRHLYRRSVGSDASGSSSPVIEPSTSSHPPSRVSLLGNASPIPFPSRYASRLNNQSGSASLTGSQNSGLGGDTSNTDLTLGGGVGMGLGNRSFEDAMMVGQLEMGGSGSGSGTWREGNGSKGKGFSTSTRRWDDGK
jgi:hypothetical protein